MVQVVAVATLMEALVKMVLIMVELVVEHHYSIIVMEINQEELEIQVVE